MTATTTFADKLVAKAKELGLPPQSENVIRQADSAVRDAVRKTAAYTDDNRAKISEALDKAGRAVDEKTEGKYADKIAKARASAEKGLDKIADLKGTGASSGDAVDTSTSGPMAGTMPATGARVDADVWAEATTPPKPTWATVDDQVTGEEPKA